MMRAFLSISLLLLLIIAGAQPATNEAFSAAEYYSLMKKTAYADPDLAKQYGRLMIRSAQNSDSALYYRAKAHNGLGIIHKNQGNYDSALHHFDRVIAIYTQTQNIEGMALAINNVGILLNDMGDYEAAIAKIIAALRTADSLNLPSVLSVSNNNLGIIQYKKENYEDALASFKQALHYYEITDNLRGAIGARMNMATILWKHLKQYEEAKSAFRRAMAEKETLNDQRGVSMCLNELAMISMMQEKYDSAALYLEQAIDIKTSLNDQKGLVNCLTTMSKVLLKKQQPQQAIAYGEKAYDLASAIDAGDELVDAGETLSNAYFVSNDYKNSAVILRKTYALRDSILGEENLKSINALEKKYETEKKEQQIAIQQAEIAEQQAQNRLNIAIIIGLTLALMAMLSIFFLARSRTRKKQMLLLQEAKLQLREAEIEASISSQEKERTRFAQDLHDGFGQMISILNLNLKSLEKEGADRDQVFEQSTSVLEDMYKELKGICFNLMPQTLIKNGIADAVREFVNRVNQAGKLTIETDFFGLDERLTEVQEISLYRIIQEWINNMLKYSDANRVTIQITRDEDELTLMIEDNGTGFDLELLKSGKGNGWRNMNSRVNLMKGELDVDTQPGMRGSTLVVNAPTRSNVTRNTEQLPA